MPTEPMEHVVVGVDGSIASLAALDLAAEEAVGRVAPLAIVHVEDEHRLTFSTPAPAATTIGLGDALELEPQHHHEHRQGRSALTSSSSQRLLATAAARALAEHPGLGITTESLAGDPASVLIDRARAASLLVVGHRGIHGGGKHAMAATLGIGSVAIRVIEQATIPVMVHRPVPTSAEAPSPRPILLGVAGLPDDEPAIEFAFAEAAMRGAPLTAMHIWSRQQRESGVFEPNYHNFSIDSDEASRLLGESIAGWSEKYPDVVVRRVIRLSLDVPVALVTASRSAQLLVAGPPRRTGLSRLVHSSVSHTLIGRADCPVAIVP